MFETLVCYSSNFHVSILVGEALLDDEYDEEEEDEDEEGEEEGEDEEEDPDFDPEKRPKAIRGPSKAGQANPAECKQQWTEKKKQNKLKHKPLFPRFMWKFPSVILGWGENN